MNIGNSKLKSDRKVNDADLLVLLFTGLRRKIFSALLVVFVGTKHRRGTAATALYTRFQGRMLRTE